MKNSRGGALVVVLVLLAGVVVAAANVLLWTETLQALGSIPPASFPVDAVLLTYDRAPTSLLALVIVPLAVTALVALVAGLRGRAAPADVAPTAAPGAPATAPWSPAPALRLLTLLQQEGRLVDFLEEDIDGYSDAQVGAAVRSIHSGCRRALHERLRIERIRNEEDGAQVEIGADHDPASLRLTGNVQGQPPFRGTLQHAGWRVAEISLPEPAAGLDPAILEPAEVEIA